MEVCRSIRNSLWATASVITLALCAPNAFAQTEAAPTDEEETGEFERVIVTATRREESIQDVPIAITALSSNQLERAGVADITRLESLSTSFNLNTSDTQTGGITLRLRGVGTTGNNIGLESSVGVFVDGVYLSRPGIALADLLDIEQIEILRGPQGTLFGRNTSAGALNIRTKLPNLSEYEFFGNATGGNFSFVNVQAGANIPIIRDKLAIRLAGAVRQRDGFVEGLNGTESNSIDRFVLRGQALWDFGDAGALRIIGDYAEGEDDCCQAVWFRDTTARDFETFGLPENGGARNIPGGDLEEYDSNDSQFFNPFQQFGFSAEYQVDTPIGALTYIGSYRKFEDETFRSTDYTGLRIFTVGASPEARALGGQNFNPDNNPTEITSTTHELRVQDTAFNNRLDWLVGFYYSYEEIDTVGSLTLLDEYQAGVSGGLLATVPVAPNPLFATAGGVDATGDFASNAFLQEGESFSIFTHNVFAITNQLDLTVGLRYVNETKDGSFRQVDGEYDACLATLGAGAGNFLGATGVGLNCFIFAAPSIQVLEGIDPALAANPLAQALLPQHFNDTFEDEELIYTVKLAYQVTDLINVFGGFTHGFKSGGFNLDASAAVAGGDPRFDSEKIDALEFGMKGDFFDGRVRANVAVFHQMMEDFQVLEFTGVQFQTFNVEEAVSTGAEIETMVQVTDEFLANVGMTYTRARYPDDCAPQNTNDPDFNANAANLCGNPLTNAPEFVMIVGGTYQRPVFEGKANVFATGSVRFETERRTSTQPTEIGSNVALPGDFQDANTKVDLRIGIEAEDQLWALEVWGNNIFDERTKNVTFNVPLRGAEGDRARGQFVQEPATYGVTVRTRF